MDWLSPQPAPSLIVTTNEQYKWALLLHTKNVPYAVCRGKWSWDRLYTYNVVKHIQGGVVQGVKGRSGYCRQSQSALKSSEGRGRKDQYFEQNVHGLIASFYLVDVQSCKP